jgi:hypothetical protein
MRPLLWRALECACIGVAVVVVLGGVAADSLLSGLEMARRWADG